MDVQVVNVEGMLREARRLAKRSPVFDIGGGVRGSFPDPMSLQLDIASLIVGHLWPPTVCLMKRGGDLFGASAHVDCQGGKIILDLDRVLPLVDQGYRLLVVMTDPGWDD